MAGVLGFDRNHVFIIEVNGEAAVSPAVRVQMPNGKIDLVCGSMHGMVEDSPKPKLITMVELIDRGGAGTYLRMLASGQLNERRR